MNICKMAIRIESCSSGKVLWVVGWEGREDFSPL